MIVGVPRETKEGERRIALLPLAVEEITSGRHELRMVSIVDELADGLSSVYTFFDPLVPKGSFGTYNILWQIEEAKRRGLQYVYLGYWIAQSRKMSYKNQFRPIEGLSRGEWKRLA